MKKYSNLFFLLAFMLFYSGHLAAQSEQHTGKILRNVRSFNQDKIKQNKIKKLTLNICNSSDNKILRCIYDQNGCLIDSTGYPDPQLRALFNRQADLGVSIDTACYDNGDLISFKFTFTYNEKGLRTSVTEHSAHPSPKYDMLKFIDMTTVYTYDSNDRLVQAVGTTSRGIMVQEDDYSYDPSGNVIEWRQFKSGSPQNFVCRYAYDARNNLLEYSRNDGNGEFMAKEKCTYDLNGILKNWENISKFGLTIYRKDYSYDDAGNMTECLGYLNGEDFDSRLQKKYNDDGYVIESILSTGRINAKGDFRFRDVLDEVFRYDDNNNLLSVERTHRRSEENTADDYFYDDNGNIIQRTDAVGNCIKYAYERYD